eukprot:3319575-Pleurochrysis_carterae.AAC.1
MIQQSGATLFNEATTQCCVQRVCRRRAVHLAGFCTQLTESRAGAHLPVEEEYPSDAPDARGEDVEVDEHLQRGAARNLVACKPQCPMGERGLNSPSHLSAGGGERG